MRTGAAWAVSEEMGESARIRRARFRIDTGTFLVPVTFAT
jgi:hypothetical protein